MIFLIPRFFRALFLTISSIRVRMSDQPPFPAPDGFPADSSALEADLLGSVPGQVKAGVGIAGATNAEQPKAPRGCALPTAFRS